MQAVRVGHRVRLCDWCAKPSQNLVPVAITTPRGAYHEDLCTECAESIETEESAGSRVPMARG